MRSRSMGRSDLILVFINVNPCRLHSSCVLAVKLVRTGCTVRTYSLRTFSIMCNTVGE